jgi:hypothetical protein
VRIGDILLADGVIGARDLDAVLSEQLMARAGEHAAGGHGAIRLGSLLYKHGLVPADVIARALARQHAVPAALGRHLEQRDPALAGLLPAELARRFVALPVAQSRAGGGLALIVCMRDPNDPAAIDLISRATRMPVVAAVACEAVLAPLVAKVYAGAPARPASAPAPAPLAADDPVEEIDVNLEDTGPIVAEPLDPLSSGSFTLVGLDDSGVARDESQIAPSTTQRPSGRISAQVAAPAPAPALSSAPTLDATRAQIGRVTERDAIADAAIAYLAGRWSGAVVLVVRDGLALGHRGFGGALTPASVEAIVVPLNQPSVLRTSHDRRAPYIGPPMETSVVQDRFLRAAGAAPGAEVAVMPVLLRERVVCLVFAHGLLAGHDTAAAHDELHELAQVMEAAFLRLIREHKRAPTT